MNAAVERIVVPTVPPSRRHPLIFSSFDALAVGAALEILNDHDPSPLQLQFERTRPGQFSWQVLESGPQQWHVRIGRVRLGAPAGPGSGCGSGGCGCGGG
jgi:uncharacterized protein (DUF2249 family)